MKYDLVKIGERIRSLRKENNISQEQLIELLSEKNVSIGRNTLSAIENGCINSAGKDVKLDFNLIIALCDLYGVRLSYLLCESDLDNYTGLKEETLEALHLYNVYQENDSIQKDVATFLHYLITHDEFLNMCIQYRQYIDNKSTSDLLDNRITINGKQYFGSTSNIYLLLLQNVFTEIITRESSGFHLDYLREINSLTVDDKGKMLSEVMRGK